MLAELQANMVRAQVDMTVAAKQKKNVEILSMLKVIWFS